MPITNLTKPKLFSPSVVREESKIPLSQNVTLDQLKDTNFSSTSSFRYDQSGAGLKSTQEISIDWSKFENHTFFNSAQSKVNISFDRVINEYPFDGSNKQIEAFEDSLTGYEKYILDSFPKNHGYLLFSGTSPTENPKGGYTEGLGTYISVRDSAGADFPLFSRNISGESAINFGLNPISFEMQIFIPKISNDNQIICQKLDTSNRHVTLALSQSSNINTVPLIFAISSGSEKLFLSESIEKGKFSHICATYDRNSSNNLKLFLSESIIATSSNAVEFESLSFGTSRFTIGSGSAFSVERGKLQPFTSGDVTLFTPSNTLSGALDEFRTFHSARSIDIQKEKARKSIYAQDDLKLHFRFNEPHGSYGAQDVVLDSSGNSLHTRISNYFASLRLTGSASGQPTNPMVYEDMKRCPILFPDFPKISNRNKYLLLSASLYDEANPNLITRLFPVHYLLEGQVNQGLSSQDGQIGNAISGDSIPGSAKLGSSQYLTAFMLLLAKFFDEIKMFIDHFSNVLSVDYDDSESVVTKLLPQLAMYYGISLPNIFPNSIPNQYISGENITNKFSSSENSLKYVQSQIWKRILINFSEIIASKGTIYSITSVIRAAGINPDNLLTIREYGGPTKRSLSGIRQRRIEVASSLDFSGSIGRISDPSTINTQGFSSVSPNIISPFLSGARLEVGFPRAVGTFVSKNLFPPHGISNDSSDGLLTSGSFTFEGIYQFDYVRPRPRFLTNQSLVRLHVSSSDNGASRRSKGISYANLLLLSGTENSLTGSGSTLRLYMRPGMNGANDPLMRLQLSGVNIFDGNLWNISFGRERSDQKNPEPNRKYNLDRISSVGSSSYFLRAARQSYGEIKNIFITSSFFQATTVDDTNALEKLSSPLNPSGSMIVIGSQSMASFSGLGSSYDVFLNDTNLESRQGARPGDFDLANTTDFEGQVSQIRFWSKALEVAEWKEHVRNFKSVGVENPLVNFNFETAPTGAFERLRVDVSTDQPTIESNDEGRITVFDFSQNEYHFSGSGFESSAKVINPETFYFSHLSPKFDVAQTDNKVRIRSYQSPELLEDHPYASSAPRYEVRKSEEPDDDTRFTIEFSSMKAIDDDIMNMFSDLDFFDNALGNVNLLFDDFYPDLEQARKVYFKRLTGKPDYQIFFDMYRWFNTSLGQLIGQLIPRKTKFLGINFIIESHVLERSKFRYLYDDIYLLALERNTDRGNLLLSQVVGQMRKW